MSNPLRAWREKRGITQQAFEALSGLPQTAISRYERGPLRPNIDNALKIERATNGEVPVEAWESKPSDDDPSLSTTAPEATPVGEGVA